MVKKTLKLLGISLVTALVLVVSSSYYRDLTREALWEEYAYPDSQTMIIDGLPVHYRTVGAGKPLVLLHGTAASLHTWEGWTNVLRDSFQVIVPDLPAFGLTGPHPTADYSIDAYLNFLETFTQRLNLDQFVLGGNSLGGLIAWSYTANYPAKVTELILVDPAGFPDLVAKPAPLPIRLARNKLIAPLLSKITPRSIIKKSLLDVYGNDDKVTEQLINRYHQMSLRAGNRQAFIDRSRTTNVADTSLLTGIGQPTLILWGAEDTWIPVEDAHRFSDLLPNDSLVIFSGLGHVPMEESPAVTAKVVKQWLFQQKKGEQ